MASNSFSFKSLLNSIKEAVTPTEFYRKFC